MDEVVVLNMPVARSVARRFRHKGITDDDLDQVAYMALTRAAQKFDPLRERDFLSYAVPTIRGELKKCFRDAGWSIRPPRKVQEMQARISSVHPDLAQRLGRSPRPQEVAEALGADLDHVLEALSAEGCFHPFSLDQPIGDGATALGETLGEESCLLRAAEARLTLAPVIRGLSDRDRRILELRFFHDATQQEIADEIGVTQMHVSRLLTHILSTLRSELESGTPSAMNRAGRPSGS